MQPLFSLIVTTVGTRRLIELRRLVESIELQQLGARIQLIFVYQSNDGLVPAPVADVWARLPNHRIVCIPVSSLSAARNAGLQHAEGQFIGFPDDDCWYPEGALSNVAETFHHTGADAICTHVMDPENGRTLGRRPKGEVLEVTYRRMFQLPISVGLFAKRESVWRANARFDTALGVGARWGAAEETDFVHTLLRFGCRCVYTGRLSVYHAVLGRDHSGEARKAYRYGAAFGVVVVRFLRAGTVGHLPFVAAAIVRSAGAAALYLATGHLTAAGMYVNRLRGFCTGALQGIAGN